MNTKAVYMSLGITLLALATFIQAYFVLQESRAIVSAEGVLGTQAAELIALEQTHQRIQLYIDQAASLAADKALTNVVTLSGVLDGTCGTYAGVPYWRGVAKTQTFNDCKPQSSLLLQRELTRILPSYFTYPQDDALSVLPRSYSFLLLSEQHLTIIGTPLEPLTLRKAHKQGSNKLVSYPAFRIVKQNILAEIDDLIVQADGIFTRCSGYKGPVDTCVTAYEQESKAAAERFGSEYKPLTLGKACTPQDQSGDRSIVLCKHLPQGLLSFALFIPLNIPLEVTTFTVQVPTLAPLDWMQKSTTLLLNKGESVELKATVTTPDPLTTRVELCGRGCVLLYQKGLPTPAKVSTEEHEITVILTTLLDDGDYYLKVSSLVNGNVDEEVQTPANKVDII